MRGLGVASLVVSSAAFLLLGAGEASAITLPDNSSCNTTSSNGCLKITNNGSTDGIIGSGNPGLHGLSTAGSAVVGQSTSGIGLAGSSSTGKAVEGSSGHLGVVGVSGGTDAADYGIYGVVNSTGSGSAVYGDASGSFVAWAGNFNGDVTGRDFYGNTFNPSDARLKKDIANASYGLDEVMKLRPVTYAWNEPEKHGNGRQVGLIAQEVQQVIPELVKSRGPDAMLALNYAGLVPVLVKAVQEQQAIIREQGREIAALQVGRKGSASLPSGGTGVALAFGLLPIGLFVGRRLRRR